jgi:hypothetical protein
MNKICITGGAGSLGQYHTEKPRLMGNEVLTAGNFFVGSK